MKEKILFWFWIISITTLALLAIQSLATNPDKTSMEISDEAITYHYSWDDANTTMTASVPLTTENCLTTCIQECKNYE